MSSIIEEREKLEQEEASKSFELAAGVGRRGSNNYFENIAEDEDQFDDGNDQ